MKTLFGIRSKVAVIAVGSLYLLISLHTSIYGIKTFQEHEPSRYLLINTESDFFHIFSLIISVSCLLSSILLILGILEQRYVVIRPWLLVTFALECILATFLFCLIYLSVITYKSSWLNACGLLLAVCINFIALVFHDYIWSGSYVLYKNFEKDSRRLYPVIDGAVNEEVQSV